MIPDLGLMIGAYICTRMFHLMAGDTKAGKVLARIGAGFTIAVTLFCVLDMLMSGSRQAGLGGL